MAGEEEDLGAGVLGQGGGAAGGVGGEHGAGARLGLVREPDIAAYNIIVLSFTNI